MLQYRIGSLACGEGVMVRLPKIPRHRDTAGWVCDRCVICEAVSWAGPVARISSSFLSEMRWAPPAASKVLTRSLSPAGLWASLEGRLMAMLEGVELLTLKTLNDATVAWAEQDYHHRAHRALNITPLTRLLDSDDASRPCLVRDELAAVFRITVKSTLRRSDGSLSLGGIRYQVSAPRRHLGTLWIRYHWIT